jgi:LemA protein
MADIDGKNRQESRGSSPKKTASGVFLSVVLALGLSGCGYNTMVSMKEQVQSAWAQVENQLQRRNDLIPNLVETTKGYAAHEKEIFESVANARSKLIGAGTRSDKIEAANEVSSALSRLLALSERYPDLKADKQFARLSDELAGTENRIATERRRYNEVVQAYNTYIKSFPTVLTSGWFGFTPEKYFEAPQEAQRVPQVKF